MASVSQPSDGSLEKPYFKLAEAFTVAATLQNLSVAINIKPRQEEYIMEENFLFQDISIKIKSSDINQRAKIAFGNSAFVIQGSSQLSVQNIIFSLEKSAGNFFSEGNQKGLFSLEVC